METCHSNMHLPLYGKGDTSTFIDKWRHAPSNARLPFVIKAGASQILNKLRYAKKLSISFLPSIESGAWLGDVGTSHFTTSKTITCGRVTDWCLLFEFLM
jgi:hypothetical protein